MSYMMLNQWRMCMCLQNKTYTMSIQHMMYMFLLDKRYMYFRFDTSQRYIEYTG